MQTTIVERRVRADRDPYRQTLDCYSNAAGGPLERLSQCDLQSYLHELLMKQDQMSMAASIESRVPFLDAEVVDHVWTLPTEFKLSRWRTKAVLRAAVRQLLPPEVLRRPKMGFPVPIGRWLRGPVSAVLDELVLGPRARARHIFVEPALRRLVNEHRSGEIDHGERCGC
jgi:asparagine synthase (glutamine-hydrolysing)